MAIASNGLDAIVESVFSHHSTVLLILGGRPAKELLISLCNSSRDFATIHSPLVNPREDRRGGLCGNKRSGATLAAPESV